MKIVYFLILLFLLACSVSGQALHVASITTGVEVIQQKWSVKELSVNEYHNARTEDPFRANNEANQAVSDQKRNSQENRILIAQGQNPIPPPGRTRLPETNRGYASIVYLYEAKIKNTGEKTIQIVRWEYVFFEKGTKREVGRQRFVANVNIHPGKINKLVGQSVSPPTGTIAATVANKKLRDQYSEQVIIQSIEYTDGSVSKADSK